MKIYQDTQEDKPPLLFLHGWCCDHSSWQFQIEHFSQNYRVIVLDLLDEMTQEESHSKDIFKLICRKLKTLCQEKNIENSIVVGHSMGGALALNLANQDIPIKAVVMVDLSIPLSEEKKKRYLLLSQRIKDAGIKEALEAVFWNIFVSSFDDKDLMGEQLKVMLKHTPVLAANLLAATESFPLESWLQNLACPALYIGASKPAGDYSAMLAINPKLQISQAEGSGHFVMLNVPEQFNAILDVFLGAV